MDISFGLESNVKIQVFNKNKKPIYVRNIHNKATRTMVQGILRYLQGHFTGSTVSNTNGDPSLGQDYIPACLLLGDPGVEVNDHVFQGVTELSTPAYTDSVMLKPIAPIASENSKVAKCVVPNILATNDGDGILLRFHFGEKDFVYKPTSQIEYLPNTYYVSSLEKQGSLIRELCLTNDYTTFEDSIVPKNVLARVVLDGPVTEEGLPDDSVPGVNPNHLPIFKTNDEFIIIDWKLSIISIGQNDIIASSEE